MIGSMDEPLHLGRAGMPGEDVADYVRRAKVVLDYLQGFRATIQAVSFDFNDVTVVVRETDRVEWVVDRYRAHRPGTAPATRPRPRVLSDEDHADGFDKAFYIGRHRAEGPTLVGE